MPSRFFQILLILSALASAWLLMQAVHELGHMTAAWLTGGSVAKVVLHPLAISRTDLAENPQPLITVWAGPIAGVLLPLLVWAGMRAFAAPKEFLARFFAAFCLIATELIRIAS